MVHELGAAEFARLVEAEWENLKGGDLSLPQADIDAIEAYFAPPALPDRPEGDADGYEWKTPPLWGIGLTEAVSGHTEFLHDGRARNLTEAILWHGGEAQKSRDAFANMPKSERDALIAFLESL